VTDVSNIVRPKIIVLGKVRQIGVEGDKKVYLIKPYKPPKEKKEK